MCTRNAADGIAGFLLLVLILLGLLAIEGFGTSDDDYGLRRSELRRAKETWDASGTLIRLHRRFPRVLSYFREPLEDDCLSDDRRLSGICLNSYDCRERRGKARGSCAYGFGVCCVFITTCGGEIKNNLTYIINPGFPNLIDQPVNCTVRIRKAEPQVTQLRIDFPHFNIGQPNARTGRCDVDVMLFKSGDNSFELCGWNSGQRVYLDLGRGPTTLTFRLTGAQVARMWELRISQLGLDVRAPSGCLQYHDTPNGTIRTFNYLPRNGRYLTGHDYLVCMRQELGMCSILYTPCSNDSFRIGNFVEELRANFTRSNLTQTSQVQDSSSGQGTMLGSLMSMMGALMGAGTETAGDLAEGSGAGAQSAPVPASANPGPNSAVSTITTNSTNSSFVSEFSEEVLVRKCRDRVLIPCDFEEFITPGNTGTGMCNLEHCGTSFCRPDELEPDGSCRLETSLQPFNVRVAFPGPDLNGTMANMTSSTTTTTTTTTTTRRPPARRRGSARTTTTTSGAMRVKEPMGVARIEDNIGMCLNFEQLPCSA